MLDPQHRPIDDNQLPSGVVERDFQVRARLRTRPPVAYGHFHQPQVGGRGRLRGRAATVTRAQNQRDDGDQNRTDTTTRPAFSTQVGRPDGP
jgi:hypothetical protein